MIANGELLYSRVFQPGDVQQQTESRYNYYYEFTVADSSDLLEATVTFEHAIFTEIIDDVLLFNINREFTYEELEDLIDEADRSINLQFDQLATEEVATRTQDVFLGDTVAVTLSHISGSRSFAVTIGNDFVQEGVSHTAVYNPLQERYFYYFEFQVSSSTSVDLAQIQIIDEFSSSTLSVTLERAYVAVQPDTVFLLAEQFRNENRLIEFDSLYTLQQQDTFEISAAAGETFGVLFQVYDEFERTLSSDFTSGQGLISEGEIFADQVTISDSTSDDTGMVGMTLYSEYYFRTFKVAENNDEIDATIEMDLGNQ